MLSTGSQMKKWLNDIVMDELIEKANGFAGVFPKHKYEIVRILQEKSMCVEWLEMVWMMCLRWIKHIWE